VSENLPKGWIEKPLADVTEPRGEKVSPQDYPDLQFIGMDHVESQTTRIIGSVPACSMKSNAARFYTNDVLYGRLRPYLNKVSQPLFDGLASAEFIVFPDTDLVKSDYLKYRLNAADFVSFASHLNEGDRPRVGFDQIGTFKIKVPPPKEQKRIVAKIEELFSELDKGIENLKTARQQLKVYRQAVLKHAFEGKLTANWREKNKDKLETSDELLERIKQEREASYQQQLEEWKAAVKEWERNGKHGKQPQKPSKPIVTGSPGIADDLAKHCNDCWAWLKLRDISEVSGGLTKNQKRNALPRKMKYLRVANVYADKLLLDEVSEIGVTEEEFRKLQLVNGDLLIVEGNGSIDQIGRLAAWNCEIETIGHQNHLIRARMIHGMLPRFFLLFLLSPLGRKFIIKQANSTSGLHTLSISKVSGLPVPVPSFEEQEAILIEVEEILSKVNKMEVDIHQEEERSEALRQSILKRAFSGRLVAQDQKDEPASVLLERIKAEKNESPKRKKKVA
jgi:type I restriction enzyme, S subunit